MSNPLRLLASQDILEAYYANVQRSSTVHMVMLDTDGVIVAANRATANIFRKTPDQIIGLNWFDIVIPPAKRAQMLEVFAGILATGLPDVYENPIVLPDGNVRIMLWSNTLTHSGEQLTGTLSFGIDVTDYRASERKLQQSAGLLQRAEEVAGLGTYVLDIPSGVWTSSAMMDGIFGIGPDNPRTIDSWAALIHPDDRADMVAYFRDEVLGQKKSFDRIYRIIRASDGTTRWVHGYGALREDAGGNVITMSGAIRDVTEAHDQEEKLSVSEKLYRSIFESAADAIFLMVGDKFVECNDATLKMFGCPRDRIIGHYPYELSPLQQPDGSSSEELAKRKIAEAYEGNVLRFHWVHQRCDGTPFDVTVTLNRIVLNGTPHLHATVRDETPRFEAEKKLLASETTYRTLVDAIPDSVGIHRDGKFLYVNAEGVRMMGYASSSEVLGKNVFDFVAPESRTVAVERVRDVVATGRPSPPLEMQFLKPDGSRFDAEVRSLPIEYEEQSCVLSIVRDITSIQRGRQAIAHLSELETLNRAMVGRELRITELKEQVRRLTDKAEQTGSAQ